MKNAAKLVQTTHTQTVENIARYLKGVEDLAFQMCYSPTMSSFLKEEDTVKRIGLFKDVQALFSNVAYLNNAIMGFSIHDEEGRFITANGNSFQVITQRDLIEVSTETRYDSIYPPNQYIGTSLSGYTLTIPIVEMSSSAVSPRVLGMMVFTISLADINKQIIASNIYVGSHMTLYSEIDKVIAHSGDAASDAQPPRQLITYTSPLADTGWRIETTLEYGILSSDTKIVLGVNVITGLIIVVIILLFFSLLSRRILLPIEYISRFMQDVSAEPKTSVYQSKEDTYQELTTMTDSLNLMLQSLDDKSTELVEQEQKYFNAVLETKRLEILAYRSQINPHFLYNTLDCISGMAFKYNAPEIVEISQALSGMFRYAIKGKDFVSVTEEMRHMQEYATIIHYRFMGRINIVLNASDEAAITSVPRLVLQPIVENAVFHGLEKQIAPGEVTVSIFAKDSLLHIRVSDNGIGMSDENIQTIIDHIAQDDSLSPESDMDKGGVGLWNIAHRLKLFYGERAQLRIESQQDIGSTVELILPVQFERS